MVDTSNPVVDSPIEFNPYSTRLQSGISLIEASAGTGKTFSIVMLVLRFIVEKGFNLDQLLVVTFTNAAAQELRDRIRFRLLEVKSVLSDKVSADDNINKWVASLPDSQQAKQRIIEALADIDTANIFTIHGFCQHTLNQYALESGQVFGSELLENVSQVKLQIAEDYWRIHTYTRSTGQVTLLRSVATSPDKLLSSIDGIKEGSDILPEGIDLEDCLNSLEALLDNIKVELKSIIATIQAAIDQQEDCFKPVFINAFTQIQNHLLRWTTGASEGNAEKGSVAGNEVILPLDGLLLLAKERFYKDALNGNKFRKLKDRSSEQRKDDFLEKHSICLSLIDALATQLPDLHIAFKQGFYYYLQTEIESRLTQTNQLSFDGIIKRLFQALQGEHSVHLKQLLQDKYPVALIDEFQDTDNAQWSIFSTLAESPSNYLYLIGDPKQAIYKFRGADIYSYLVAKNKAKREYNLATNWRSKESLVKAVNTFFDVKNPFLIELIAYHPVRAALSDKKTKERLSKKQQSFEHFVLWELDKNPEQKEGYWLASKGKPKEQIRQHVIAEILALLDDKTGIELDDRAVCPADIAILVRSNTEAASYQQRLSSFGIPAVLNSKSSVFKSTQADEIYHLLHAISRPGNQQLLRYALCLPWFGYSGNDLHALLDHPRQMDEWLINFQRYHDCWESKGLLPMMHLLMEEQQVAHHLANNPDVERNLTNINHILELLQAAAISNHFSIIQTMEWLEDALQERVIPGGQELRLESDANAVDIVTIHGAKGLEYPIVFCPDLWAKSGGQRPGRGSNIVVFQENGQQISDLGSEYIEQHRKLAETEEQAEECRLLYVALTRAKYRCYLAWADQRTLKTENQSALAYLLKQQPGDNWTQRMSTLIHQTEKNEASIFDYQLLEVDKEITDRYIQKKFSSSLANKQLDRVIKVDWMMSSYSALAYYSVHDADISELPLDKSEETEKIGLEAEIRDQQQESSQMLPRGAHTGNLVHELLEYTPFQILANELENAEYIKNRTEMTRRFGVDIKDPKTLDNLLRNTVSTALSKDDKQFILANLSESQCLKEMPFYFAVERLDTGKVNAVLKYSNSYLPLTRQKMHGQLTGFIDLICEYKGQYFVMDYKSNSLPDYSVSSMTDAMREHNYGLQYWIYSLVLHRYLQQTLPRYQFDKHFGGVRYLFVRGMSPAEPMSGVFEDDPDLDTLEAFSSAFCGTVTGQLKVVEA